MVFNCSQCSFTAQFESALTMHRQLHHESSEGSVRADLQTTETEKGEKTLQELSPASIYSRKMKGLKLGGRTSSATRILGKLRARICRTKTLSTHAEDPLNLMLNTDYSSRSECTSKAMKLESPSRSRDASPVTVQELTKETYACHLCSFDTDRITVLDRHLLNDHKIGLDNLLKLVLAKTTDGLSEDNPPDLFGIRQPYYRPIGSNNDDILDDGEFVIETVSPKIRILKHSATNTELTWGHIPDLRDNCQMITKELDTLIKYPAKVEKNDLLEKMQTLNDYMCKFVSSSNTLKKALSRDVDGKFSSRRERLNADEQFFDLRLEDQESARTPRDWERAHSEKLQRFRCKHSDRYRSEKSKLSAESYYF